MRTSSVVLLGWVVTWFVLGGCRSHESLCKSIDCTVPLAGAAGEDAGSAGTPGAIAGERGASGSSSGGTSGAGGQPEGGKPSTAGSSPSGGAASDAGAPAVGGQAGVGGQGPNDEGGAAGSGPPDDSACPSAQPDLLNNFENNRYDVCPPRAGFWAFSSHVDLACPVIDVCWIQKGGTAAHALAFEPPATRESLMLDLRRNGAPAPDAGTYTGIAFSALGPGPYAFDLRIEAYTSDIVLHEHAVGGEPGGGCVEPGGACGLPYETTVSITSVSWEKIRLPFSSLTRSFEGRPAPFDAAHLLYFRFALVGEFGFSIDDVSLLTD